jgi:Solute carrier family 12
MNPIFRLAALLSKFRIEYCDVIVIPDIAKKALESTKRDFENLIKPFKATETDGPGENRAVFYQETQNPNFLIFRRGLHPRF